MIQLVRPHGGPHTQRFGNTQPDGKPHAGDDYGYTDGVYKYPDVYAAAPGVVVFAGDSRELGWPNPYYLNPDFDRTDVVDSSAGNVVVIRHDWGFTTYNHLESWDVIVGQEVDADEQIGITGDTGYSFGKHLHFELILFPVNFNTPTYGRTNPAPYWVVTIATQSTTQSTTTIEEDNMAALTDEEQRELLGNTRTLIAMTTNVANTINTVKTAVEEGKINVRKLVRRIIDGK